MASEILVERKGPLDEKYILVEFRDESIDGVVSLPLEYHRDIAAEYRRRTGKRFGVLGGGRMCIYEDLKVIKVYDTSGDYGRAPTDRVAAVLMEHYPSYELVGDLGRIR